MNTSHLYLKPGPDSGLLVVEHTFAAGAPLPAVTRQLVAAANRGAWLAGLVTRADLKGVYNCAGSGAAKPAGLGCPWFDLPAGHPCESL